MTTDESFTDTPPQSYLVADCGSTNTTVALFDQAAGSYRLIASTTVPTTAQEPWANINLGVKQAVRRLAEITGRTLLSKSGNLIRPTRASGIGIDAFAAVISTAPPFNTLLVGLFDQISLESAHRTLNNGYTHIIDTFSLADTRGEGEQINSIIQNQPDLIFLVGGIDGGAEESLLKLAETTKIGVLALSKTKQPRVVFAGNKDLREQIRAVLGEHIHLHVADNVRPTLNSERTDAAAELINEMYVDVQIGGLPGIQDLRKWSNRAYQTTTHALAKITESLAVLQGGRTLVVDLGSNQVTLITASPDSGPRIHVRTDMGMGQPIMTILEEDQSAAITRWMSSPVSDEDVQNYILNKAHHSQTVPLTTTELNIEQAVAREMLHRTLEDAKTKRAFRPEDDRDLRLLVMRGDLLTSSPRPNQALLILLDTLLPTGIFPVVMDAYGVLPALGVLVEQEPLAAIQTLEGGPLVKLGWVVVPTGKGQPGQKMLNVLLESDQSQRLEVEVEYGTIEVLPLDSSQSAQVTLQPSRRFDIGFGPGKGKKLTIRGGVIGLVIDGRGRPLNLPDEDEERQTTLRQWLWDIGG